MDEILNLIESVSEGFPSYFYFTTIYQHIIFKDHKRIIALERSVIDYWGAQTSVLDYIPRPVLLQ